jgi:hypothetical protein
MHVAGLTAEAGRLQRFQVRPRVNDVGSEAARRAPK